MLQLAAQSIRQAPHRRGLPAQYASCALSAGTRSTEPWLMDLPKYSCSRKVQQRQRVRYLRMIKSAAALQSNLEA
jgi:hypothetical protein